MKMLFPICCAWGLAADSPAFAREVQTTGEDYRNRPNKLEGLYLNMGIGRGVFPVGSPGASFSITALLQRGWGAAFVFHYAPVRSPDVPADYGTGSSWFGSSVPPESLFYSFSLTAVRKHYFRPNRHTRWGWEAGPSLVQFYKEVFTPRPPIAPNSGMGINLNPLPGATYGSGRGYQAESVLQNTFGLQLALNAAWVPTRLGGLEANLWGNLNAAQSVVGIEFCVFLGKGRSKGF